MDDSEEAEPTQYAALEDAVAAHPELCLQALAVKWGLEYGQLERPKPQDARPTAQKRKADTESESRRVRHRVANEFEADISIVSTSSEEVIVRRRTTFYEPYDRVLNHTTLRELLADDHPPERTELSPASTQLRWGTNSSTRAARHHVRAMGEADPDRAEN